MEGSVLATKVCILIRVLCEMPCSSVYSDRFVVEVLSANPIRLRCLFCSNDIVVFVLSGADDWENAFCCFALVHLSLTEIDAVQLRSHVNPIRRLYDIVARHGQENHRRGEAGGGTLQQFRLLLPNYESRAEN